jgi:hypothetical protein
MPFINHYNRMDKVIQEALGSGDYKPCNIFIECDRRSLDFNSSTTQEKTLFSGEDQCLVVFCHGSASSDACSRL